MLLTILLFPSLLYVVLSTGTHNFIKRPFYGPKTLNEFSDTVYYSVNNIEFQNCKGDLLYIEEFEGNITLIHFITFSDSLEEKRKASQLIALNDRFKEKSDIKILSVVFGDSRTTCNFKKEYSLNTEGWQVVNFKADKSELKQKLIFNLPSEISQNKWTNLFVVVDKQGRIRSYRDAIQYVEERALIDDIKILKAEEFIPKKKKKSDPK